MSTTNIYSNAFNFSSFINSGVDARTGQYTASINLTSLTPFNIKGDTYDINLNFSSFNSSQQGFGHGWNISTTFIDTQRHVLSNHTGESYKCKNMLPGAEITLTDKKLRDLRAFMVNANQFRIQSKEGLIQTIARINLSSNLAVVTSVAYPNGEIFDFTYGMLIAGRPCLTEIHHRQTNSLMLRMSYFGSTCNLIQVPDSTGQLLNIDLTYQNNLLTGVSLPYLPSARTTAGYTINYAQFANNFFCIDRFRTPSGSVEVIQYNATGIRITMSNSVPCVTGSTINPGNGQPPIITTYQYSQSTNFTGFSSGRTHIDPEQDNLYLVNGVYNYSSTESKHVGANVVSTTTRTYNRFHLLTREETTHTGKRLIKINSYNETAGVDFYRQPPNLQLVAEETIIHTDLTTHRSREERSTFLTDEWGNTLRITYPSGIQVRNEYYGINGQAGLCPADPLGFSRFIRSATKIAAYGNTPNQTTNYTWESFAPFANTLTHGNIMLVTEVRNGVLRKRYTYINSTSHRSHSLLNGVSTTLNNFTTTESFSYTFSNHSVVCVARTTGHDNTSQEGTNTVSFLTGDVLEQVDEHGVITRYEYTPTGHIAQKSISTGNSTPERKRFTYSYPTANSTNTWPMLTETDTGGVSHQYRYDGLGRVCQVLAQDDDAVISQNYNGTFREIKTRTYNSLGQVVTESDVDWAWDLNAAGLRRLTTPLSSVKHFEYDGWGNLARTTYNDGRVEIDSQDPVSKTALKGLQGLSMVQTQYNLFDEEESVSLLNVNGTVHARRTFTYDGFGRRISETDTHNHSTHFTWDHFDRRVSKTLPDGTQIDTPHSTFTDAEAVSSISVQGHQFAEAARDGLLRITRHRVGNRTLRYAYRAGGTLPETITTPDNREQIRRYAHVLNNAITQIRTSSITQDFDYGANTGKLIHAREAAVSSQLTYFPSGLLQEESTVEAGRSLSSNAYRFTMAGRVQRNRDSRDRIHTYQYDNFGRLTSTRQGAQEALYRYDSFGRKTTIDMRGTAANLVTTIRYDEFSREISRTYVSNDSSAVLTMAYTADGKISTREMQENGLVLREIFTYDNCARLSRYQCSGRNVPRNSAGTPLSEQRYHYDRWGNIIRTDSVYGSQTLSAVYEFNAADPTQLMTIIENGQRISLQYDANGNLTRDEKGQTLIYDAKNRLSEVRSANNQLVCRYRYNAHDVLISQEVPGNRHNHYFYSGKRMSNAHINNTDLTWLNDGSLCRLGHTENSHGQETHHSYGLLTNDVPNLIRSANGTQHLFSMPFGHRSLMAFIPGISGAQPDPVTGWYFLGNGYRVYNPVLMRFHSPDNWSPFGQGGINPYVYTFNDPINNVDPSGHLSDTAISSIALGAIGILMAIFTLGAAIPAVAAKSVAIATIAVKGKMGIFTATNTVVTNVFAVASAATSESNPVASRALNFTNLALGLAGIPFGFSGAVMSFFRNRGKEVAERTVSTFGTGHFISSAVGINSRYDAAMMGTSIVFAIGYASVTVEADSAEEENAELLGIAGLAFWGGGVALGLGSMARAWRHSKYIYQVTTADNVMLQDINFFSAERRRQPLVSTRL
ncbi:RHS repeat-associated core domain-containing protein [Enterobacter sp. Bisph1]|uniref:RHS repeat domain-containing protein n=1 Tax=Enterobacter sp. Bisph1 TaxID=1274399 RepID=UPI00057C197F|nr:RHS repeat-associated core domain-containing protein [Enterobacter sp. Bisph1]